MLKRLSLATTFKSKYCDIELMPEEEFFRDALEDTKGSVISNDNAHNLMLKRLKFELFQVFNSPSHPKRKKKPKNQF
jgi:THO complex subunit 5